MKAVLLLMLLGGETMLAQDEATGQEQKEAPKKVEKEAVTVRRWIADEKKFRFSAIRGEVSV